MHVTETSRGFEKIDHPGTDGDARLVSQSSAIGDTTSKPGSSYLGIGEKHHLNRNEVRELVGHLETWLETGSLIRDH